MQEITKSLLELFSSEIFRILLVFLIWRVSLKVENSVYKKNIKEQKTIKKDFEHACAKTIICFIAFLVAIFQFKVVRDSAGVVLTSTSLLVALVGFCFQEAFSNVIHGVILVLSEHFQVGDRITFKYNGEPITGIIRGMDMRCMMVEDIITSSIHLVPNTIMDKEVVQNFHMSTSNNPKKYQIVVEVTYETNIELALKILQEVIGDLPQYVDTRSKEDIQNNKPKVSVFVRSFNPSGVELVGNVCTKSVEENFAACSDARRLLLKEYKKNGIDFAYPHMEILEKKDEKASDIIIK